MQPILSPDANVFISIAFSRKDKTVCEAELDKDSDGKRCVVFLSALMESKVICEQYCMQASISIARKYMTHRDSSRTSTEGYLIYAAHEVAKQLEHDLDQVHPLQQALKGYDLIAIQEGINLVIRNIVPNLLAIISKKKMEVFPDPLEDHEFGRQKPESRDDVEAFLSYSACSAIEEKKYLNQKYVNVFRLSKYYDELKGSLSSCFEDVKHDSCLLLTAVRARDEKGVSVLILTREKALEKVDALIKGISVIRF